jgi:predicted N-acyltransferase
MSDGRLFTLAGYRKPLEDSGCADPEHGWTAAHLSVGDDFLPCYRKTDSWGEFVFDHSLAHAYAQHGLPYYPKLVSCVPFTPVPGPRLLAGDATAQRALAQRMLEQTTVHRDSSAHILFMLEPEAALLQAAGWLRREQLRYVWHDRRFGDFDGFLAQLSAKKRKNIRRERRLITEADFTITWCHGGALSAAEWETVYQLYASTYRMRGRPPYLTLACLQQWAQNFPEAMLFCLARHHEHIVAMAFFFRDGQTLYGRHWGAQRDYDALHFELCYYQGIDYCLREGLHHFDAGVQGDHKHARGFDAECSISLHWFAHRGFHDAIGGWFVQERAALARERAMLDEHSAFRRNE